MNCPRCNSTLIKSPDKTFCCLSCGYDSASEPSEAAIEHANNRPVFISRKERDRARKAKKQTELKEDESQVISKPKTNNDKKQKYAYYTQEDKNLIVLVCETKSVREVSKETGIEVTTIYNWRRDAGFEGHSQATLRKFKDDRVKKAEEII